MHDAFGVAQSFVNSPRLDKVSTSLLGHGGERKDGLAEFMGKNGLYFLQHEAWNDDKTHIIGENATSSRPLTHQGHRAVAYTVRLCPLGPGQALQSPDPTATARERPH